MRRPLRSLATVILSPLLVTSWSIPAIADPPPWAPAHGYRSKNKGKVYEPAAITVPFGINSGRCNREQLGQVLGGAIGAAAGATVKSESRPVAIIAGTVIGVMLGGYIGRRMDEVDQHCVGQALEHAKSGQTVSWTNPDTGARYSVIPQAASQSHSGEYCREYRTRVIIGGSEEDVHGVACRQPDGSWKRRN